MALKAALMLLCLTGCSVCHYVAEPVFVRTEDNRLKADGLILSITCEQ
ncbi:MAG: hypothetical protein ACR65O_05325 [Methylomicrobium sp.]